MTKGAAMNNLPSTFAPASSLTGRFAFGAPAPAKHPLTGGTLIGHGVIHGGTSGGRLFSVTTIVTTDRANAVRELLEGTA